MSIYKPELKSFGSIPFLPLNVTHKDHISNRASDFTAMGNKITETGKKNRRRRGNPFRHFYRGNAWRPGQG